MWETVDLTLQGAMQNKKIKFVTHLKQLINLEVEGSTLHND